uniref:Uncharacterized protein n=1 Tax=Anopheles merus TaxID=30066 RepID=A0A182VCC6_ANOME
MPFAKRLLRLSGFRQDTELLEKKIFFNLFVYVAALLVPKVCSPYPNSEVIIRGLSELIFFTNVYVGYYCFVVQHRDYRDLLNAIDSFLNVEAIDRELKKVIQLHQLARRCVTLLNQTLSFVMALQLALCILTWCFTLLYILIVGFNAIATNGLLIMINMTLEMFGYCFFCTELDTTGKIVSRQMYEFR